MQAPHVNHSRTMAALGDRLQYRWSMAFMFSFSSRPQEPLHEWQQPVEPCHCWLSKLTRPGTLVADPFAGSGPIGAVCVELGLRYVGTEVNLAHYEVARGRLLNP